MPARRFEKAVVAAGGQATGLRALRNLAAAAALVGLAACSVADGFSSLETASTARTTSVAVTHPRFEDTDPHEWDSGAPWSYAVHGIDVSKYQTSVDWHKARASGVSFAFIKATEGGDRIDSYFDEHWSKTKAAGVPRAA
jgi:lysozyme